MDRLRVLASRLGRGRPSGFSLLELLVVLAILALLAGIVGPQAMTFLGRAKAKTAGVQIENIETALDVFLLDTGRYPTEAEGLQALVADAGTIPGWQGPYMDDGELPQDPWGQAYRYKLEGGGVTVYSLGADNAEGGSGDDADIGL